MSTDTINRKRAIDINKLSAEQVEQLTEQISKKILVIVDEAITQANKMLNIYGLEAKMQIALQKQETLEQ